MMRKIVLILLLSCFLFTGCGEDKATDQDIPDVPEELIAEWRLNSWFIEDQEYPLNQYFRSSNSTYATKSIG
jgi:PBP1b-binding outer membrane lipoprotein LpoB